MERGLNLYSVDETRIFKINSTKHRQFIVGFISAQSFQKDKPPSCLNQIYLPAFTGILR